MNLNYRINVTKWSLISISKIPPPGNQSKLHSRGAGLAVHLKQGCFPFRRLPGEQFTATLHWVHGCKDWAATASLPLRVNSTKFNKRQTFNHKAEALGPLKDKLHKRLQFQVLLIIKDSETIGVFDNDQWENPARWFTQMFSVEFKYKLKYQLCIWEPVFS